MSYTQKQIERIIGNTDSRVIPKSAPLTLSQRVSESEVRRRVYSYEDAAARDVLALFKRAYADIREHSSALAEYGNIRTLSTASGASSEWRRRVTFYAQERITTLLNDCANLVIQRVPTAYNAGYLGRAWSIDVSTVDSVHPTYQVKDSRVTLDTFAQDWQKRTGTRFYEAFENISADYAIKFKKAANNAVLNGETVMDANKRFQRLLGLNRKDGALALGEMYFATQSNVRMAIMGASNIGALRLYQENVRYGEPREAVSGIGTGYIIITAGDGRTCPVCIEASRELWRIDPLGLLTGPVPPLHPNCRCAPFFVIVPSDLMPPDTPPDVTWQEWLHLGGFDGMMGDFMGEGIETERVGELGYADL